MLSARYRKLVADLQADRGRVMLMLGAVAVSLVAVIMVLGAWGILSREISVNYLGTQPAAATLELENGVNDAVLAVTAAHDAHGGIRAAEAREVIIGRASVGSDRRAVLLFVVSDFRAMQLNRFRSVSGAWPPPTGTVLIEQSAVAMAGGLRGGSTLTLKTRHGREQAVALSGVVHDPGLAPAWQEREIYLYATRETAAQLGEGTTLHELRIGFRREPATVAEAETWAESLATDLALHGQHVHQIRVPPPRQHPHARQMMTILLLLAVFAGLSLVLSAVLVASSLSAMLARQGREIAVMKTVGARRAQIVAMYVLFVAFLGAAAVILAMPIGLVAARTFAASVSATLNFTLTTAAIPWWVFATATFAGTIVPLVFAAAPILRATGTSVHAALDDHGVSVGGRLVRSPTLPPALRNLLRRPARLLLTLGLLSTGGALFVTALSVSAAWERNLQKMHDTRHYDVEVRLDEEDRAASGSVLHDLESIPGVRTVEAWGYESAAFAREGHFDVARTYPDRGHGSLSMMAPPPDTQLIHFPIIEGRWLRADDTDGVVLNHVARAQAGGARLGDELPVSIHGHLTRWRVVGIVEEIGSPAVVYATEAAFAAQTGRRPHMLRVATDGGDPGGRAAIIRAVDERLLARGVRVESVVPFSELRTAIGDHVFVLVQALVSLATIFAVVGLLGLASALGTSVIERTRELGVMKALGARSVRIRRMILEEVLLTTSMSGILGVSLALPLTRGVEVLVGRLGFLAPLPFVVSSTGVLLWWVLLVVAAILASLVPLRRATQLTVHEALTALP